MVKSYIEVTPKNAETTPEIKNVGMGLLYIQTQFSSTLFTGEITMSDKMDSMFGMPDFHEIQFFRKLRDCSNQICLTYNYLAIYFRSKTKLLLMGITFFGTVCIPGDLST